MTSPASRIGDRLSRRRKTVAGACRHAGSTSSWRSNARRRWRTRRSAVRLDRERARTPSVPHSERSPLCGGGPRRSCTTNPAPARRSQMGREQIVLAHQAEAVRLDAGNPDDATDRTPSPDLAVAFALPWRCLQVELRSPPAAPRPIHRGLRSGRFAGLQLGIAGRRPSRRRTRSGPCPSGVRRPAAGP